MSFFLHFYIPFFLHLYSTINTKIVVGKIVISLDSEWIENSIIKSDKQKQDCETNAFKRMIKRIKKNYPKYKFIITGDGLYATTPIIKLCKKYKWNYIFNLKPDRLKEINETFEDNINYQNETTHQNYCAKLKDIFVVPHLKCSALEAVI